MKKYILLILFSAADVLLAAQDSISQNQFHQDYFGQKPLSLQDCIIRAVEESFELKILNTEEQIARNNFTRGNAGYKPVIRGNAGLSDGRLWQWQNAGHSEQYIANIAAEWTAYDGGKRRYVYEWLRKTRDMGELNTALATERLVGEVITIYYDLVRRRITADNMQKSMLLSRYRLQIAQEKFLLGVASRPEVLQAELDLNADSSAYIIYEEGTKQLKIRFKQYMQIPYAIHFDIADSIIPLRKNLEINALRDNVLASNISLQIYEKNRTLADLELKQVETEYNPTINISGNYGYTGVPYGNGTQRIGLAYIATASINIYDGGSRKRRSSNARLQQEIRNLEYQNLERQLMADLHTLYSSYKNYQNLLQFETSNSKLAEEKADLALEQYQRGQLSSIEMREFQNTLLNAQNRLVSAVYQAKYSEIKLLELCTMASSYLEEDRSETMTDAFASEVRNINNDLDKMSGQMETSLWRWKRRANGSK